MSQHHCFYAPLLPYIETPPAPFFDLYVYQAFYKMHCYMPRAYTVTTQSTIDHLHTIVMH